jgi:hypothetical protein
VGAFWDEDAQKWHVRIQRGDDPQDVFEDEAHIFVNASGVLKYVLIPTPRLPYLTYWLVSGNGLISQVVRASRVQCFTAPIGMIACPSRESALVLSAVAHQLCKLCQTSSQVGSLITPQQAEIQFTVDERFC